MLKNEANRSALKLSIGTHEAESESIANNFISKLELLVNGTSSNWWQSLRPTQHYSVNPIDDYYVAFMIGVLHDWSGTPYANFDGIDLDRIETIILQDINHAVQNASQLSCLTSPYKYIRECKKWYLDDSRNTSLNQDNP